MANGSFETEPKKRSRRFYLVIVAAIVFFAVIAGAVIFSICNIGQTNYGTGPVDIEVTSDRAFYLQGEEVNFTIYVHNQQNWSVPYPNSVICVVEKNGLYVASVGGGQLDYPGRLPTFPPHSKTLYWTSLLWNQKMDVNGTLVQVQPGNYTYTVSFEGAVNYGNSGNCTFEIR